MRRMDCLKVALTGGVSAIALSTSAYAANFNIPGGDLETALNAYSMQAVIPLIVSDEAIKGARTKGAKGELTASAALSRILEGTGFAPHRTPTGAIAVVHETGSAPRTVQQAQAAPVRMAATAAGVESVIVTSSKIKGDIQTVPIAITALSQEQLTQRQIAGGPDLVKEVPNLTFSKTNFTGYNLQIRGIGTQAISVTIDPAVAVAFNDTPFLRNHFFEQEFYDLSQVEVLRGPQGTLYGRNANAGVVNIVSAKPTDQFEAALSADFGNFHNRRYEGMLNLPIVSDKLDLRIAGEWTKRDGYAFNEIKNETTDGRNLWSSRATLRWRPIEGLTTDLIWEHFQENDDRLRSGKQLCKTDLGPGVTTPGGVGHLTAADGTDVAVNPTGELVYTINSAVFSQGCLPTSLYSPDAFQVPNGFSMPFITGAGFTGFINGNVDPYTSTTQSTNLRDIQSEIDPIYRANNDTLEFNAEWQLTPSLTFNSETGYNRDFLWSTEDFNRFDTTPGIFVPNHKGLTDANGVFCDPQLGCSDRLVVQDLATEASWQLNQEFRLSSNFEGPFNFSAGGNYLHYETQENYYVFSNTFTMIAYNACAFTSPYVAGESDSLYCLSNGKNYSTKITGGSTPSQTASYVDPNPLTNLNDNGRNYFLSKNPYVLNSYALFGETYYQLTEDLKLTGGLRWTDDEKHFPLFYSRVVLGGYGVQQTGQIDQVWQKFSGRAVLNWTPKLDFTDQTMVYASYSHGYKAGGANPPPAVLAPGIGGSSPIHPFTFEPEYIDAYELGTKNTALDGGLTVNADIFYYDYKGYQISQIVDRTSVNINVDATVQGAELQLDWSPLPGLKFGFNGGYEDTRIKNNQSFIDLMDRTYGHHDSWIIMKPWPGEASNCVFPTYVAAAIVQVYSNYGQGNPASSACSYAYGSGLVPGQDPNVDPVTGLTYAIETGNGAHPPVGSHVGFLNAPAGYPGFDPTTAPNFGEGFVKPVGGNELPNAPHFTVSLAGDYTIPVSESWAATLHSDFYWQSQSMARIFNDRPYDKIRGYSNVNLALILTDATGWQVMGYVKNIFDTTAITGDFLNSDDTGLTTNIFVTDPRLYGLRVTKHFDGGSENGGFNIFSNDDGKRPSLWLTVGGNFNAFIQAKQLQYEPAFAALEVAGLPDPASIAKPPEAGFDWEGQLAYQPQDSDWVLKAGIRYGRTSKNTFVHKSLALRTKTSFTYLGTQLPCASFPTFYASCHTAKYNEFLDAHIHESERHTILDFTLGRDIGLGSLGTRGTSTLSAGVRAVQFGSKAASELDSNPYYNFDGIVNNRRVYDISEREERGFHGIGPEVSWNASAPLFGDAESAEIALDLGLNGGLLFGKQSAKMYGKVRSCEGQGGYVGCYQISHYTQTSTLSRSRSVTVPNLGGYIGASVRYSNAKISFGYRVDEFFGAMDGGQATVKKYNRGFAGPYLNLSVGLGG